MTSKNFAKDWAASVSQNRDRKADPLAIYIVSYTNWSKDLENVQNRTNY